MSFILFDTEYTTWKGCQEKGWHGWQKREIVQIGALKVSDELRVVAEFSRLCRPVVNPIVSDYFTSLTHITNEQIQREGILFPEMFSDFTAFVGNDVCFSHAWGRGFLYAADGQVMKENLKIHHLPPDLSLKYRNIAAVFKRLYKENNIPITHQASGEIVGLLGLKHPLWERKLKPHDALFDVYSLLEGLKYFGDSRKTLLRHLNF